VFDFPVDAGVVAVNMLVIFCRLYTLYMKVETGYVFWSLCHSEMRIQQTLISHNLQYCGRSNDLLLGDLTFQVLSTYVTMEYVILQRTSLPDF
jgi:hypothetical protein